MKRAAVNAGFAQKAGRIATQDSLARFGKGCAVAADIGAKIVAAIGVVEWLASKDSQIFKKISDWLL